MSDERSIDIDLDDSAFLAWTDEVSQLVFAAQQRHNDERTVDEMKRNPWLVLQEIPDGRDWAATKVVALVLGQGAAEQMAGELALATGHVTMALPIAEATQRLLDVSAQQWAIVPPPLLGIIA
jgi:hypothetical protein